MSSVNGSTITVSPDDLDLNEFKKEVEDNGVVVLALPIQSLMVSDQVRLVINSGDTTSAFTGTVTSINRQSPTADTVHIADISEAA